MKPKHRFVLLIILCIYLGSLSCDSGDDACTKCSSVAQISIVKALATADNFPDTMVGGTGYSTGGQEGGASRDVGATPAPPSPSPPPSPRPSPSQSPPPPPPPPPSPPPNNNDKLGVTPAPSPGSPNSNSQINDKGRKGGKLIVIVVVVAVAAVPVSVVCGGMMLKRRRHAAKVECKLEGDVEMLIRQHAPKRYKYSEIKKMTKCWSEKLGEGGYGSVYKGMLPDGRLFAVKVLVEMKGNGEDFMNEVASICRTSHVNIVTLLGFCCDRKRALLYEFMPNGSLDKFLNNHNQDSQRLYKIAVGIAKGLQYLHNGCKTRIVHFDIKPQNILLDEDLCPKISDFGLAKLCKEKQSILTNTGTKGTVGYIAPERLFSRGVSHKSDVYSYGIMLLDMVGARNLAEDQAKAIQSGASDNYFPDEIYEQVINDVHGKINDDEFIIKEEEEIKNKMCVVAFWCMQTNPSDRPSISKVVEMLEGTLKSIEIPPKPLLFSPNNLPTPQIESSDTQNSDQPH